MKTDEELLEEFCSSRNHTYGTRKGYESSLRIYTKFNQMTLFQLLDEAEQEEQERIRWKDRKLRRRLINYRRYLYENYLYSTANFHLSRIQTFYKFFDIELQQLPYISTKTLNHAAPLTYHDLPDKEIIRKALKITGPLLRGIILFITSSGSARAETIGLTIQDFIDSLQEYTHEQDIYKIINELHDRNDIIPTFKIRRRKTNEYYYTFCSPECTNAIFDYLLTRKDILKPESKLFKINNRYLSEVCVEVNNYLGLGKKSTYNRFRTHMLRKFHSTTLSNSDNSLTDKDIDFLQGRSDRKTRQSYFFTDEQKLKIKYAKSMNDICINKKYNVLVDDVTSELIVEEYDADKVIKPLKAQAVELKKENQELKKENLKIRDEIQTEARKVFEDILRENNISL